MIQNENTKAGQAEKAVSNEDSYWRDRFNQTMEEIFKHCNDLVTRKNSDYTKMTPNRPFDNFHLPVVDNFLHRKGIYEVDSVVLAFLDELNRKQKRIANLLLTGERLVLDETIEDTLCDAANYNLLLLAYLRMYGWDKTREKTEEAIPATENQVQMYERELTEARRVIQSLVQQMQKKEEDKPKAGPGLLELQKRMYINGSANYKTTHFDEAEEKLAKGVGFFNQSGGVKAMMEKNKEATLKAGRPRKRK